LQNLLGSEAMKIEVGCHNPSQDEDANDLHLKVTTPQEKDEQEKKRKRGQQAHNSNAFHRR
jgi:hypothetical protein